MNLQYCTLIGAGTLHSTLFSGKPLIFKYIQNVGCLSTLHSTYICPTLNHATKTKNSKRFRDEAEERYEEMWNSYLELLNNEG